MIPCAEALERILALPMEVGTERLPLAAATGRMLAGPVAAPWPMPRFDNSSMDGFALRAADGAGSFDVVGESAAGRPFAGTVGTRQAIRISTGAMVPPGLDAVVPIEQVRVEDGGRRIVTEQPPRAEVFLRRRSSDVAEGQLLFGRGTVLTPAVLAFLAGYNLAHIEVLRRPRVAILTSGEELRLLGDPLGPGDIVASSLYYLERELAACGCEPMLLGISPDDPGVFRERFAAALAGSDFVVTTAGVSVGEHDVVKHAIDALGGKVHFWRVAVRPGKPMVVASFGAVHHFGLPGNPVSTWCNTEIFLKPWLRQRFGIAPAVAPAEDLVLAADCPRDRQRLFYVAARTILQGGRRVAIPLPGQNSGNLLLAAQADTLLVVEPGDTPLGAGDTVQAMPVRQGLQVDSVL